VADIDVDRLVDDLQTLVRIRSITGSEENVADWAAGALIDAGLAVEVVRPDLHGLRADPAWPGEEMDRVTLPIVVGRAGQPGGRRLILSGHLDVVPPGDPATWTVDPWGGDIVDGRLFGRGSCDMKGGVACMVYAAEILARLGVRLAGDLIVNTVTDEESSGAGGIAAVRHGVAADAGIVTEPTAFDVWVGCRGSLSPTITVEGRPGHAEMAQPHWREGGAVNAIEKMAVVLEAVRRLRDEWRGRPDKRHPYLSPGDIVPAIIGGGEWIVSYPASCTLSCELMYLPGNADAGGWGTKVEAEVADWILRHCAADPWLAEHPPQIVWSVDIPPYEVDPDHPIVSTMLEASAAVGEPSRLSGLDSWFDAASFSRFGGTPSIGWGPRSIAWGHTIDEYVPVDDLVRCAQGLALAALRYCGQGEEM